ncbi:MULTISPECIES: TonB-dependent receptor [unclassified Sphingomonas]|uniref:TonB-dependent receptor n=1 Tax=unclassified Sphingomonas TaxID=196159 RepID=UPI000E73E774|nr:MULTISPECIES: TonB-dependent receptor [unclassified Sphingomonas]RKE53797.1 TonB-dependent receptor [Sphingomonas sp. PP-CC-1A-547]TCM10292.1 TonB-dependent receptor [Sphingomonas sp. PP-CC-3G-468]
MTPFKMAPRLTRAALLCATTMVALSSTVAAAQTIPPTQDPAPAASQGAAPATAGPTAPAASPAAALPDSDQTPGTIDAADSGDIVVTGYRSSLAKSTNAKRAATGFTDSIFAEDIGKFPDTNIAESFNRIPGITITRDVTGEGTNVAIRGLGSNFTNVTLNGATIAVASSGATDAQGTDRSVDLSFFPTDLFTKLTVNKSYTADLLEGGAAGNIDLRSARPFDRATSFLAYNVQGTKQSPEDRIGARGSLIGSWRGDKVGILAGVSAQRLFTDTRGFETIGYTNPALTAAQCGAASGCNTTGGGNWTIPTVVPVGAGAGLVAGTPITSAFLLANNPGATIQQIDNALLPRLGRSTSIRGPRDRINAIVSAEWQPSDTLHFYVDGLYGYKKNDLTRENMAWIVRNGAIIPTNLTFDKADCTIGCVVTGGTFANAQFFNEFRPYTETTKLFSINPGGEWEISDTLKLNLQGNYARSTFHRENPSVGLTTPLGVGNTVTYSNDGSGIPMIQSALDLNDPANFGWNPGSRVNISDERRLNKSKGARGDLTWGKPALNLKIGGAFDDVSRRISSNDNSQAYQNAVCGNNPSVFVASPNSQPPCEGLNAPGVIPAGYPTYPGFGTGSTAGMTGPVTYGGSLVPNSAAPSYLTPGPAGFVTVDWPKFAAATNYDFYHDNSPESGASTTGASGGGIREVVKSAFATVNGEQDLGGNMLRFNVGVRYVNTIQTITGRVSLPDPRNTTATGVALPDGSRYPNLVSIVSTRNVYSKWLPAATFAYDVSEHAVVRVAGSRTMTRPDPSAQLPGVNFGAPSADQASIGNPALEPYMSTNIDLGFEYYTGREGVVSFNAFRKSIKGFTNTAISTVPFSNLSQYGITYDTLNPTQQIAINSRGGPGTAQVQVTSQVNVADKLTINGLEFQWVQPLDFLTKNIGITGFGFNANATVVDQTSKGAATAFGVAPFTYNITGYYEKHGVMLRVSTTSREGSQNSGAAQNGIPAAALFGTDYTTYDFSSSFDLDKIFGFAGAPQLTVNVANFTNATLRSYFQFENATFTQYKPGRQFLVGLRGTF